MNNTFDSYTLRASHAMDVGFTSEASRKSAIEWISRAFDIVMDEIGEALLSNRDGENGKESADWKAMYWGRPQCHAWKDKHAKLFARFPELVNRANRCAMMRAEAKAMALVAKKPSAKKAAADAKREAESKTCQICGRPIFAETGVIAHHGYQRPGDGWQTASCYGARHVPFEADRDTLGLYLEMIRRQLAGMEAARADVAAERVEFTRSYEVAVKDEDGRQKYDYNHRAEYRTVTVPVMRAGIVTALLTHPEAFRNADVEIKNVASSFFDANKSFDHFLRIELASRDKEIKDLSDYIDFQQARFDGWKKTHEFNGTTWGAV